MKIYGLIGHPLSHSFSKKFFEAKFEQLKLSNCRYNLYDIDSINKLEDIRKNVKNIAGLNVTIPYKEAILPYLDEISDVAKKIGAVNTIKCSGNIWKGYNTDYYGIYDTLIKINKENINACLVLGTGGTSKTISFVLNELGIESLKVSRNKTGEKIINYAELNSEILEKYNLIINTSPLGMHPQINGLPEIPYSLLNKKNILFDMIYNPEQTLFLKRGLDNGCKVFNGLNTLYVQAEESWKIWNE